MPKAWNTETAAGAIVIGALVTLIAISRGFRGVTVRVGA